MIPLLKDKSYSLAVEIVRLVQYLQQEKKEYVLSKQILKSGTSIGAQIHEAVFAQSDSDYLNKLAVSLKEANETLYWLNLLRDTDYIHIDLYEKLAEIVKELIALLASCVKTLNNRLKSKNSLQYSAYSSLRLAFSLQLFAYFLIFNFIFYVWCSC